jgi:hypothetical protein
MASLSNINGIFDVHSTGAIQFNGNHGTAGQILKSNGNAAPTWVAASTVIGGPYLPLTGGTLSGATATATGISFTVGGALGLPGTAAQYVTGTGALATFPAIPQGDITAVIAGTDLSGGGTSGSVTLNNTSTLATVTGRGASTGTSTTFGSTGVNTKLRVVDTTYYTSPTYSWTNSAIQTTSIEIIDATSDNANVCATLVMHNYGDGGVKFRMGNTGDKTLYLSSGQSAGAGNPTDDNSGTYFDEMKINNAVVYHTGNLPSGSGVTSVATGSGLTGGTITTTGTLSLDRPNSALGAVLATYGTTAGSAGRIRCTAPFNTNSGKMFSIEITLYSSYTQHNYVVSAYMYSSTNQWYSPKAIYTTTGTATPDIYVGRDANGKAYISIANASYTGVIVHNMTRGYQTSLADTYDPWTIAVNSGNENSVSVATSQVWTTANHTPGNYLPLAGGTMSGLLQINTSASSAGSQLKIYATGAHQYPQIYSNGGWEAMWNYKNNAAEWYVGLRTSSQLLGTTGFHFYNTTSGQTVGGWDISGNSYSIASSRAPVFYDSNNTAFYGDFGSGSQQQYTQNISGTSGNYGSQLIVGQTSIALPYSLQDGNVRPIIAATGQYPCFHLNHTVTSNANHGPTIQFTYNGLSGRQWLIGGGGTGEDMQIGYSDTALGNSNYNPHNGISGYSGVTYMMCKNNGRIGLGAAGDWGAYGGGYPGYAIDTRGTLYNNTDVRAPIFYDSNNTAYYVNPADYSQFSNIYYNQWLRSNASISKGLYWESASPGNGWHMYPASRADMRFRTGAGNGGIVGTISDETARGYIHWTTSNEIGFLNSGRSWSLRVDNSGNTFATSSHRAPIFYDSNNTGYYVDPASTSNLNALQFNYTQHGSANNIRMGNSTTMNAISSGTNNAAFGVEALGGCSTGSRNFAYGYAALYSLSSGGSNIAMGDATGYNVTSGSNNLLFGQNAGRTGYQSPQSIAGVTSGSNQIHMGNESHSTARIQISWTVNSDSRDKTDITPIDVGLDFVKDLNPVTFRWDKRSDYEDRVPTGQNKLEELTLGFLAQEVEEVEKSYGYNVANKTNLVVDRDVDQDHFGITYEKMIPILTKAIQEQQVIIDDLKSRIEKLEL